jgi:hypothetical protein
MSEDPFVRDQHEQEYESGAADHGEVMADVHGQIRRQTRLRAGQRSQTLIGPQPVMNDKRCRGEFYQRASNPFAPVR